MVEKEQEEDEGHIVAMTMFGGVSNSTLWRIDKDMTFWKSALEWKWKSHVRQLTCKRQ